MHAKNIYLLYRTYLIYIFSFLKALSSKEFIPEDKIIIFGSSIIYASFKLYIYCYLFNNINIAVRAWLFYPVSLINIHNNTIFFFIFTQKASVTFGIYSCNWTMMDIKFKKLVQYAMQMNDATQSVIKATPKKIIDLQLFANVCTYYLVL